ncbi:cation diffusion facilitator family transporter [Mycetocola sp.]|jgi:cobalt-zinc-cadmium efflux system protein|uniref:cation diffusion facilitator family transporter n=1 Tax=Mycetocola sp. TaxID=1871042 RepID=UPI0026043026|nr:cation diffusion facilitator family transporter [Mycetocola sp.]MCU1559715.1 cation transporter [Mycetocola sp.]
MAHNHAEHTENRRKLVLVLGIVAVVLVAEVVGGILTGSLALLADAGHMFSDLTGLVIALVALGVAARPATQRHTYGYRRVEVLAALLNGFILFGVAVSIAITGVSRLLDPSQVEVLGLPMLVVAIVGLLANVVSAIILRSSARTSINMRGAYFEVLGDLFGSIGVIIAAGIILATGFVQADAIASLVIAAGILPRAFALLRDVWRVLNQSTPPDTDIDLIRRHIQKAPGVIDVHDVHVWSITTGEHVFTAHVVVEAAVFAEERTGEMLDTLSECLAGHFDVEHSTFQLEPAKHAGHEHPQHS